MMTMPSTTGRLVWSLWGYQGMPFDFPTPSTLPTCFYGMLFDTRYNFPMRWSPWNGGIETKFEGRLKAGTVNGPALSISGGLCKSTIFERSGSYVQKTCLA